jgi:hypothetical protein
MDNYNSKHPCIQQKYICSMMNFMVVFISFFYHKKFHTLGIAAICWAI